MPEPISRRNWMRMMGVAGAGGFALSHCSPVAADMATRNDAPEGVPVDDNGEGACTIVDGQVIQPRVTLPTAHETDVLVVGGGPAGAVAAIAAARSGVKTTLVERYGHFGGLSTGGLVLIILGHWGTGKKQVCQGIGEEIMQRLDGIDQGIVNRREGVNPTVDAEALKQVLVDMIVEAGVDVFLHSWAAEAVMDGTTIRGVVFESKSGRQAILAKQVVDTTGDGDILAAAGAAHEERIYHIGLPYRIGGLDKVDQSRTKGQRPPRNLGGVTPINGVRWVNMHGPDANGLDVRDLSKLELAHRRQIWKQVAELKATPGYEDVYLLETACQMGVRVTRALDGVDTLTIDGVKESKKYDDCLGVGGAWNGDHQGWQVPLGALLPKDVENLLTAGRSIAHEPKMSDLIRVIPNCWVTGHAAGAAAAVAADEGTAVRDVKIPRVKELLLEQKAYLG